MSILLSDLKLYAAAVTPEDDAVTGIGGAIDLTKKFLPFNGDFSGPFQIVSSEVTDVTQTITLTYRDPSGAIKSKANTLNGHTVVTDATIIERVLKVVKSAACDGDVALESQTAERTGTLPAQGTLSADEVTLESGASSVDGAYVGMIFRVTDDPYGSPYNFDIYEIIDYVGATRKATLSRAPAPYALAAGVTYRISKGVFLDKTPSEIMYVVRMDYDPDAPAAGAADVTIYVKGFFKHTDASGSGLTAVNCVVKEFADPTDAVTFALATAVNDTGTNGGGNNRQVAPVSGVTAFSSSDKNTPNNPYDPELAPGDYVGVWQALLLKNGRAAIKSYWTPALQVTTP